MSYKVLIADDEYFIRQRIKKIIPWEELDLSFCGEAQNGEEVLSFLSGNEADILILDIKMPCIDGIETSRYISEHYPSLKVIVLSGYNEFEYARTTMKYGIKHYLLKPADKQDLCDALSDCIQKLEYEKTASMKLDYLYRHERRAAFNKVLTGQMTLESLLSAYPGLLSMKYALCIGMFSNDDTDHSLLALTELVKDLPVIVEPFQETEYAHVLFLLSAEKESMASLGSLLSTFLSHIDVYTFLTLSPIFPFESNWSEKYQHTLSSLNQRYFCPESTLHMEYEILPVRELDPNLAKVRQRLIQLINTKNLRELESYVTELFTDIRRKKNIQYMKLIITEIFLTYNIHFTEAGETHPYMAGNIHSILEEEYSLEHLKEGVLSLGLQCMEEEKNAPSDIIIYNKITAYIEEHFAEPDLSVAKLADILKLNASYMGTVFKKINNKSILQYLIQVRMEFAAKLLLEGKLKIGEIADEVGYGDVFYFSKRFKKVYGCSPKDYVFMKNSKVC